jgi:hypothetical protein
MTDVLTPTELIWMLTQQLADANAELERLKAALRRIADSESGHWGWIAHEVLHPERKTKNGTESP